MGIGRRPRLGLRRIGRKARAEVLRLRGRPAGPSAAVTARYAAILDGQRLWLALDDGHGEPALRAKDGRLLFPHDDLPPEADHHGQDARRVRLELTPLLLEEGKYGVVVASPEGVLPVRLAVPLGRSQSVVIPTPDRTRQLRLARGNGGILHVAVQHLPPVCELLAVAYVDGAVEIVCRAAEGRPADLVLVGPSGEAEAVFAMDARDGALRCTLHDWDLPREPATYRLCVRYGDDLLDIARRNNSLRDASNVALPFVLHADGEVVSARLRFRDDGTLVLRKTPHATERPA